MCTAEEPPVTAVSNLETPPPSPCEPPPKKGKKGKRRKRGSKQNTSQQQGQAYSENTPPDTLPAVSDNTQESVESPKLVADSPGMNAMEGETSAGELGEAATITTCLSPPVTETDNIQNSRKRKRRDTYSISPPHKQARASVNLSSPPGCQIASDCASQTETIAKETEPASTSPPEMAGPPVNRKRRDTYSNSPPSSRHGPTAPTVKLSSKDDGKIQSEIMDLLQKRVEDRSMFKLSGQTAT